MSDPLKDRATHDRSRGTTLTEVVVSTLLVGLLLVGALNVVGAAVQTRRVNDQRLNGPALALELWSEVSARAYEDPEAPGGALGLETGEVAPRENFDDVDDYEGWSKSPPEDAAGTPLARYAGWTREVEVDWTSQDQGDDVAGAETGLKRFLVRVTAPDGTVYERQGLRWKNGAVEQPPMVDKTVVTHLASQLQIGSHPQPQATTVHLVNHADTP